MQEQRQTTQTTDIPKWSALLVEAVNKPGTIMKAYSAFWSNVIEGLNYMEESNSKWSVESSKNIGQS